MTTGSITTFAVGTGVAGGTISAVLLSLAVGVSSGHVAIGSPVAFAAGDLVCIVNTTDASWTGTSLEFNADILVKFT